MPRFEQGLLFEILGVIAVGAEIQRPLATIGVGGLFTSTALTLLLLPLFYEWSELLAERKGQKISVYERSSS